MGLRRRGDAVLRSRCRRALLELSAERGYAALSPGEVSERAGIDGREWRRLYADLEDCACEVLLVLRDEFVREVTASSLDKEIDARARFMLLESAGIGERAILIRDQGMDAMISLIDLGRGELDDPGTLGRSTAEGIAGAVFNRMRQIVVEGSDPVEARRMVPEMMFAVVLPYLGEDAAMEELRIPAPAAGPSLQGANL
jgi:hypothetical protein